MSSINTIELLTCKSPGLMVPRCPQKSSCWKEPWSI